MPKNAKPGKIILGILILLTVEGSICRVDIPWYEGLISLGMKRSGNEGTMGKHEKTLRGGEEPPKKLPLVVLSSLLLSPFQHHPRRQLYNSNRSLGSFELT